MAYFGVGVSTDDDLDRTWCALAQDCVDVIERHVVNHSVVYLHDLIPTPKGGGGGFRQKGWKERKNNTEEKHVYQSICTVLTKDLLT